MADQLNKPQQPKKPARAPKPAAAAKPAVSKPAAPMDSCGCGTPAAKPAVPQTGQQ